jgi:hypothetical protein
VLGAMIISGRAGDGNIYRQQWRTTVGSEVDDVTQSPEAEVRLVEGLVRSFLVGLFVYYKRFEVPGTHGVLSAYHRESG